MRRLMVGVLVTGGLILVPTFALAASGPGPAVPFDGQTMAARAQVKTAGAPTGVRSPDTITVPEDADSIQAAIGMAQEGDTILVVQQDYVEEGPITIDKPVTLTTGTAGRGARIRATIIGNLNVNASNTTIDGMAFTDPAGKCAILCTDQSHITITNNIIYDVGRLDTSSPSSSDSVFGIGIVCATADVDDIKIINNEIRNIVGNGPFKNAQGIAIGWSNGNHDITNLCICNNHISDISGYYDPELTFEDGNRGAYGVFINHAGPSYDGATVAPHVCNNYITRLDGFWAHGIGLEGRTPGAIVLGNYISDLLDYKDPSDAVAIEVEDNDGTGIVVQYNAFTELSIGVQDVVDGSMVNAIDNWWDTTSAAAIAGLIRGTGTVIYEPFLLSNEIRMASGGHRLADMQNEDGGWGWPLTGPSAGNTVAPIAMGLAKAYRTTGDPHLRDALQQAGVFLLTKTNNFSPPDGYLAAELDSIFGGTTYRDYVMEKFYEPLRLEQYMRQTSGGLTGPLSTVTYIQAIHNGRSSIPNLAAWDIGMGLVGAASCGVSGTELGYWIQGVKDEINGLDGGHSYDVIGLAGALYGLAFVGEEFDPTDGQHAEADSLAELAVALGSYQIEESGGFAYRSDKVIPYDYNEAEQETAYAMLALEAVGGHEPEIAAAKAWLRDVQLCTGGWGMNEGAPAENNEVTGEALWAIWTSTPLAIVELLPAGDQVCYDAGDELVVELKLTYASTDIIGGQFYLEYNDGLLTFLSADASGDAPFMYGVPLVTYDDDPWLDYGVGVPLGSGGMTHEPTVMGRFHFSVKAEVCDVAGLVTFRTPLMGETRLARYLPPGDPGDPGVYPDTVDLVTLTLDGTPPVLPELPEGGDLGCNPTPPACTELMAMDTCDVQVPVLCEAGEITGECDKMQVFTYSATDACGNRASHTVTYTWREDTDDPELPDLPEGGNLGCNPTLPACTELMAMDTCDVQVRVLCEAGEITGECDKMQVFTYSATDRCGNSVSDTVTYTWTADSEAPTIDCGGDITVYPLPGEHSVKVTWEPPAAEDNCTDATALVWSHTGPLPGAYLPVGDHEVSYSVKDACGNESACSFVVHVRPFNGLTIRVELEGVTAETLTRCVTVRFGADGCDATTEWEGEVEFEGRYAVIDVPELLAHDVDWNCASAEDSLHTLTRTVVLTRDDSGYVANFTGANVLLQGDLIDEYDGPGGWVDILDFGVYVNQWGWSGDADTTCSTTFPHPDMDGDGVVDVVEFGLITTHFWAHGDPPCCGSRTLGGQRGPRDSITLAELAALGLSELAVADLNGDGVVDTADIEAFMSGATPKPKKPVPAASEKLEPEPADVAPGLLDLIPAKLRR